MSALRFAAGMFIGYAVARFFSGKRSEESGMIPSLRWNAGAYTIHLHHWVLALLFIAVLSAFGYTGDFTYGALAGIAVQGLGYGDFYRIIYRRTAE